MRDKPAQGDFYPIRRISVYSGEEKACKGLRAVDARWENGLTLKAAMLWGAVF